ncbi:unnamed protein product, partial [Ectocarpus fasciculatus]
MAPPTGSCSGAAPTTTTLPAGTTTSSSTIIGSGVGSKQQETAEQDNANGGDGSLLPATSPWPSEGWKAEGDAGNTATTPQCGIGGNSSIPTAASVNGVACSIQEEDGQQQQQLQQPAIKRELGEGGARGGRRGGRGRPALGARAGWRPSCESPRCNKSPSFGFPGSKGQFCHKHSEEGMINVRRGKCMVPDCTKSPSQDPLGAKGQKARFCKDHRIPGRECRHPSGCSRLATHAPPPLPLPSPASGGDAVSSAGTPPTAAPEDG